MNEEYKKRIHDEYKNLSPEQREFKLAQLSEKMSKYEIHKMKYLTGITHQILNELGVEDTIENASKIYELLTLIINFDEIYKDKSNGLTEVLDKM